MTALSGSLRDNCAIIFEIYVLMPKTMKSRHETAKEAIMMIRTSLTKSNSVPYSREALINDVKSST